MVRGTGKRCLGLQPPQLFGADRRARGSGDLQATLARQQEGHAVKTQGLARPGHGGLTQLCRRLVGEQQFGQVEEVAGVGLPGAGDIAGLVETGYDTGDEHHDEHEDNECGPVL